MKATVLLSILLYATQSNAQIFITDSLFGKHVKSGYANEHFDQQGDSLDGEREGEWYIHLFVEIPTFEESFEDSIYEISIEVKRYLIRAEGNYDHGEMTGLWKYYAIDDETFKTYHIANVPIVEDQWHGKVEYFYPNGPSAGFCMYKEDTRHGDMNILFEDGSLAFTANHIDGDIEGDVFFYYKTGELREELEYLSGRQRGKHIGYYKDSTVQFEGNYTKGYQDGESRTYYENGQLKEIANYSNGYLHGSYEYYYENGQLWVKRKYYGDMLWNIYELYDPEGNPMDFGTLKDGNGWVIYYTEEGEVYMKIKFKKGKIKKQIELTSFE